MGKGLLDKEGNSFERKHQPMGCLLVKPAVQMRKSLANLGADPSVPFRVFDDVRLTTRLSWKKRKKQLQHGRRRRMNGQPPTPLLTKSFLPSIQVQCLPSTSGQSSRRKVRRPEPLQRCTERPCKEC
jgi:hypothetical protein